MSQLIAEKENERFAANTADMTQDDFFVIAILEMCTDPELSKRFREVKTDELTWEKLKDVAEVYETTEPCWSIPTKGTGRRTRVHRTPTQNSVTGAPGRGTQQKIAEQIKRNSTANSAKLKDTYPKLARKRNPGATATKNLATRINRGR